MNGITVLHVHASRQCMKGKLKVEDKDLQLTSMTNDAVASHPLLCSSDSNSNDNENNKSAASASVVDLACDVDETDNDDKDDECVVVSVVGTSAQSKRSRRRV